MNTLQKYILGVITLVVIVLGFRSFGSASSVGDATVSNYPTWYYNGIVIGPSNSLLKNIIAGTCNLSGAASMSNLASATVTCPVTGAKVGDKVFVTSPSPVVSGSNSGFPIVGAKVTSTNTIGFTILNSTGSTGTPSGVAITGINYLLVR